MCILHAFGPSSSLCKPNPFPPSQKNIPAEKRGQLELLTYLAVGPMLPILRRRGPTVVGIDLSVVHRGESTVFEACIGPGGKVALRAA